MNFISADQTSINKEAISKENGQNSLSIIRILPKEELSFNRANVAHITNKIDNKNANIGINKHIAAFSKSLKQYSKKKFLMSLQGQQLTLSTNPLIEKDQPQEIKTRSRESLLLDYFFDFNDEEASRPKPKKLPDYPELSEPVGKKVNFSYFALSNPPSFDEKYIFFVDFVCNTKYITQDVGSEGGENKKSNDSIDNAPKSSEEANLTLSDSIDYHSIEVIHYLRKINSYLDPNKRPDLIKLAHSTTDKSLLEYLVDQKMSLDHKIHFYEDSFKFQFRPPLSLSLENTDGLFKPTFNLPSLHFLYYILVYLKQKAA